ncbi:MAG TPA: chromate resistance protein ChrB domain-containing protein [bacterium]|nr:chromate resistance protein ChrB domain-containing protein [bacterium]
MARLKWLLLIHQIPHKPSYLRVKIWRRLQTVGAVALKNSVYVLPDSEKSREDFEWLRKEITAEGGEADVCESQFGPEARDEEIVKLFTAARKADYENWLKDARGLQARLKSPATRMEGDRTQSLKQELRNLKERLEAVREIDFFASPSGTRASNLLLWLENLLRHKAHEDYLPALEKARKEDYQGKTWVTRRNLHVDRLASAWLIQRFIDPKAKFLFVDGKTYTPKKNEVRFDMFEAEFTHHGNLCTFEVMRLKFHLQAAALRAIAEIIHDIDLEDFKYGREETSGVEGLVDGAVLRFGEDAERVDFARKMFDSLYEHFLKKP